MRSQEDQQSKRSATVEALVVLCTCPDLPEAERLARGLVDHDFAACVNILPEIRSIYRWQGKLQKDGEVLIIVKTTRQAYAGMEQWLSQHHPYDVPEILAMPVAEGSAEYLEWVLRETTPV
jgi:periplasmic divalent cation tolerance protein